MLAGCLVVALYEWAATRELPHYGRGLPPRYYVPQVLLPPPRQLDQLPSRPLAYPAADLDDQATWIASPAMRAEALADWPIAPVEVTPLPPSPGEDTMVVDDLVLVAAGEEFHANTWVEPDPVAGGGGGAGGPQGRARAAGRGARARAGCRGGAGAGARRRGGGRRGRRGDAGGRARPRAGRRRRAGGRAAAILAQGPAPRGRGRRG